MDPADKQAVDTGSLDANGYLELTDVRELVSRTGKMVGTKVVIQGEVVAIFDTGEASYLAIPTRKNIQLKFRVFVATPDGSVEGIMIGYNGDTTGIYKGSVISVYGTVVDTMSFVGADGGAITQPLIDADKLRVDE